MNINDYKSLNSKIKASDEFYTRLEQSLKDNKQKKFHTKILRLVPMVTVVAILIYLAMNSMWLKVTDLVETDNENDKKVVEENKNKNNGYNSITEGAVIFDSIDKMVANSNYVIKGLLTSVEPVEMADWAWEVYSITKLYKGNLEEKEIRIMSRLSNNIGSEYIIFADGYENPIYPYPIIYPLHRQASFRVKNDGSVSLENIKDNKLFPAIYTDGFENNLEEMIKQSTSINNTNEIEKVVDQYPSMLAMKDDSDLIIKVVFSDVIKINQYVWMGRIEEVIETYKKDDQVKMPKTIFLNQNVEKGKDYIIFLKGIYDDGTRISARNGAFLSENDEKWDELIQLLNEG